jgi:hypothetical protein
MRYTYLPFMFAATSAIFTLLTPPSFAQTPVLEQSDSSVNLEKSVSTTNEVTGEEQNKSSGVAQVEAGESVKQPKPALKTRIPIESRVFTAPIMQQ